MSTVFAPTNQACTCRFAPSGSTAPEQLLRPHVPQLDRAISAGGDEGTNIVREGNALDETVVRLKRCAARSVQRIDDLNRAAGEAQPRRPAVAGESIVTCRPVPGDRRRPHDSPLAQVDRDHADRVWIGSGEAGDDGDHVTTVGRHRDEPRWAGPIGSGGCPIGSRVVASNSSSCELRSSGSRAAMTTCCPSGVKLEPIHGLPVACSVSSEPVAASQILSTPVASLVRYRGPSVE